MVWVHWLACTVGRGSCPRRQLPGTSPLPPNPPHSQVCHCEPARTLVWQSVPLQAAGLRAPAGAQYRPGGMTGLTAGAMRSHCGGCGLPRRYAPRNDRFGGLIRWGEGARQICRCPAGASPRPTGAWPEPGALGRMHRRNPYRRAGVLPPPPARQNRCTPAISHNLPHVILRRSRRISRTSPHCHPEAQPKDLTHWGSVLKPFCARSFAFGSG